ncbi:MAG: hypothetical protein EOL92_07695 [Bacteroidia bacterium]|jgi:hypothetical protein|nr:hypothetical protein [Bacteroidia bacterium]
MKKTIPILIILSLLALLPGCDDSFLEENRKETTSYILDGTLFVNPTPQFTEVTLNIANLPDSHYKVVQYPQILHFASLHGEIDGSGNLIFKIKVDPFESSVSLEPLDLGTIVLEINGFGLLSIPVMHYNPGIPHAELTPQLIDLDSVSIGKEFTLTNQADGYLLYRLAAKPNWIRIKQQSVYEDSFQLDSTRVLHPFSQTSFSIIPDREQLPAGTHEGEIILETNDPDNPRLLITVKVAVRSFKNPDSMIPLEGKVIDAEFDKLTNSAILITQNPARLITYQLDRKEKRVVSLERNPSSIQLSSDHQLILVGMNDRIESFQLSTLQRQESFVTDFIVTDITDGENGRYYFSDTNNELYSLERKTAEVINHSAGEWQNRFEGDVLLKLKGKPTLLLSRNATSPNGVFLVDIAEPAMPRLLSYWHTGFGPRYWTSEDQQLLFSTNDGKVYHTPDETTGEVIRESGKLIPYDSGYEYFYYFSTFDHNAERKTIWGAYRSIHSMDRNIVTEFDDQYYNRLRTITLNDYVFNVTGKSDYYKTMVHYLFTSGNGSQLLLVKNIDSYDLSTDAWHLELLNITNAH